MSVATTAATWAHDWLRRVRAALPLAWRHDPVFRTAVVIGGVALVTLLLQAEHDPGARRSWQPGPAIAGGVDRR